MTFARHLTSPTFLACLLAIASVASAQAKGAVDVSKKWPDKRAQRLIHGILHYDRESILKAGDSLDRRYRPYLTQIANPRLRDGSTEWVKEQLALALAKLGDPDQLQEIFCHIHSRSIFTVEEAANRELAYIAGWFSIQTYLELSALDAEFYANARKYAKTPGADVVPPEGNPSYWAVQGLSKIVPNAPFPPFEKLREPPSEELSARVQAWRSWIATHQTRLKKLKPTGAGVDFSQTACQAIQEKISKSE